MWFCSVFKINTHTVSENIVICEFHKKNMTDMITHLHGNVPCHVDMAFKLVHPNFCNSEGVSPHVRRQILSVGFVSTLYMGDASAGQNLNTAATLPHLVLNIANAKKRENV